MSLRLGWPPIGAYTGSVMRIGTALTFALTASLTVVTEARAEVHLTIRDGRVSLNATGATVREILIEWAKVGQTKIVNAERIAGGATTLQLTNVPEEQALDVILRSVSGYLAAPRATINAGASRFDRILIMPTSTPPRAAAAGPPPPAFNQPQFNPPQPALVDDDADGPRSVVTPRGPIFNTFPQPQQPGAVPQGNPAAPVRGTTGQTSYQTPGQMSVGSAVPGMIVQPSPPQPGQPPQQPQDQ